MFAEKPDVAYEMVNFSIVANISEEGNHTFCVRISEEAVECGGVEYVAGGEKYFTYKEGDFWLYLCLYMAFVLLAGEHTRARLLRVTLKNQ